MPTAAFFGIPTYLDSEFVELVSLYLFEEDEDDPEDEPYERVVWLIRLSEIIAIAYPLESWSKHRFEQLLNQTQSTSDFEG